MKNLLSLLAALGLTATAATTVIACGSPKNSVVIKKTALKDLNLKTRLKNSVKNQQAAFDSFIEMNPEVSDLHDNVQVIAFDVPDYNKEGSLEVEAKTNTKYSGTLTITIPELNKTDITGLITNTTIQGTENMTVDQAFQAFLEANNSWTNLGDYVEVDSFTAATYTSNGSLTIKAKTNTAYTGSIEIRINAIGQTSLNDLHLKTLLSTSVTNQQAAFDLFIKMNPEVSDLSDDVQIVGFTAPDYNQTGSLEVEAKPNTNYSGTLTITIPELNKTDITRLINNQTIQGTENMTVDQAFQAFLEANNSWTNLNDYVEVDSFTAATYTSNGSLTIKAKTNTAYTGSIEIRINAISQVDLSDLTDIVKEVSSTTTKDNAFQTFLDANKTHYPDLAGNLVFDENSFIESTHSSAGSYRINAIPSGKYKGSVEVTIAIKVKVELSSVITTTEITGSINQDQVIEAVLRENSNSGLVASDLEVTDFKAPTIGEVGSATIKAVDSSGFIGSANITIVLFSEDLQLTEIINKIKSTPPESLAAVELWKEYFAYYSEAKIQYIIALMDRKYTVSPTQSDADKEASLTRQVQLSVEDLLHEVMVLKDGLNPGYDVFDMWNPVVVNLDTTNNTFTVKISLNFIWYFKFINVTETRTITINFQQVE